MKKKIELVIRKEDAETVRIQRVELFHMDDAISITKFLSSRVQPEVTCTLEVSFISNDIIK